MSSKKKPSKVEVRDTAQNEVVKAKVANVTAASALQNLGTAQASVGRTLATVGEQVQSQLQVLEDVKKVVALTQTELEELHGKDQVLRSIEELQAARRDAAAVRA